MGSGKMVETVATDNAVEILKGVILPRKQLYGTTALERLRSPGYFQIRYIALILSFVVK